MNLKFWKQSERMQPALVSTEDGRIVDMAFPVELGYLLNEKENEAYILQPSIMVPERKTGKLYAIVDERDALPMPISAAALSARIKFKGMINKIAAESWKQAFYRVTEELKKQKLQEFFGYVVVGGAASLFFLMILMMIISGRLKMPHIGG